ncbi:TPA: hypothetical protein ACGR55_005159, partial [Escherichia coli]
MALYTPVIYCMIKFQQLYISGRIHDIQNNFFSNTFLFIFCHSTTTKIGVCQPKGWHSKSGSPLNKGLLEFDSAIFTKVESKIESGNLKTLFSTQQEERQ